MQRCHYIKIIKCLFAVFLWLARVLIFILLAQPPTLCGLDRSRLPTLRLACIILICKENLRVLPKPTDFGIAGDIHDVRDLGVARCSRMNPFLALPSITKQDEVACMTFIHKKGPVRLIWRGIYAQ